MIPLAAACQGVLHCHDLRDVSSHDEIALAIIMIVVVVILSTTTTMFRK